MGQLKPGTKYVYERVGNITYAREPGSGERFVVGYDYQKDPLDHRNFMSNPSESQLWHNIRRAATGDKELQDALDRVKVLYYLKYENKPEVPYHPV